MNQNQKLLEERVDLPLLEKLILLAITPEKRLTEKSEIIKEKISLLRSLINDKCASYDGREQGQLVRNLPYNLPPYLQYIYGVVDRYNSSSPVSSLRFHKRDNFYDQFYNKDLEFLFISLFTYVGGYEYPEIHKNDENEYDFYDVISFADYYLSMKGIGGMDKHLYLLPTTDWRFDSTNMSGISDPVEIARIKYYKKSKKKTFEEDLLVHGFKICNCEEQEEYQLITTDIEKPEEDISFRKIPKSHILNYDLIETIKPRRYKSPEHGSSHPFDLKIKY